MTELNQVQYYERRESEQRQRARAATMPDIVSFHIDLADRYRQLASEARVVSSSSGLTIVNPDEDGRPSVVLVAPLEVWVDEKAEELSTAYELLQQVLAIVDQCGETLAGALIAESLDALALGLSSKLSQLCDRDAPPIALRRALPSGETSSAPA